MHTQDAPELPPLLGQLVGLVRRGEALEILVRIAGREARLTVGGPDDGPPPRWAPSPRGKPAKASQECGDDVLALLAETDRRMTAEEMVGAFAASPSRYSWSLSTVTATCTWLRQSGRLGNASDGRGRGFGLPEWAAPQQQPARPRPGLDAALERMARNGEARRA